MGEYRVAQVCLNGHVATPRWDERPERRQDFCAECGEQTTTECPKCTTRIRGWYDVEGLVDLTSRQFEPPNHCYACGAQFPWTERRIQAAIELSLEDENLSDDDRETFRASLADVVQDGPRTGLGATRIRKILGKVSSVTGRALRDIVVDIVSETAKRTIFGDPPTQ